MAIGRISGSVLKSNLTRNGVDLAFETNLLYLDVTNNRVGIGTSEPNTALHVVGNTTITGDLSVSGNIVFEAASINSLDTGALSINDNNITGSRSNEDIVIQAAGTGRIVLKNTLVANTIESDDSTAIQINDGVNVSGTLNAKTLITNTISSEDSSAIQINDAINVSGLLTANAGLTINNNSNTWLFGSNGATTLPAGGTITEGVVTSNPTIQLTPATPTVASQKLVIKGGGSYSFTTNGININYYVNTGTSGDTLTFYVYSDTYANQTLYWWIYPVGVGMTTPDSGTVVLSGAGGNFSVGIDSDAYEFTVRVSPEADNYNAGSIGVESGLINADAPPFTSEHHLHLTTGNLTETSIFLGTDDHNVRTTTAGNIQITTPNTTNKVWEFGTNGVLTFPDSTTQNTAARITVVGDDSTGTTLNAGETIKIAGTQNVSTAVSGDTLTITGSKNIEVNEISSGDSSAIQINDAVNVSGTLTATGLVANGITYPSSDGSANQVLTTNGAGQLSFTSLSSFTGITFVGDDSTGSTINTAETFKIAGTQNITTAVSGDTLTITGPDLTGYAQKTDTAITIVGDDSTGTAVTVGETFKIVGGSNITTAVSGDTLTINGSNPAQGITFIGDDSTGTAVADGGTLQIVGAGSVDATISGNVLTITSSIDSLNTGGLLIDDNKITGSRSNEDIEISTSGTGVITTNASIIPTTDDAVDLGSLTKRFRKGYFGSGTVYIGDQTISSSKTGLIFSGRINTPSSMLDETAKIISKIGIDTSEKTIDRVSTSDIRSSLYYQVYRDEIRNEVIASKTSIVHDGLEAFMSVSAVVNSTSVLPHVGHSTLSATVVGDDVLYKVTGDSAINSIQCYRLPLLDNTGLKNNGRTSTLRYENLSTAETVIDTWSIGEYRSAKYFVSVSDEGAQISNDYLNAEISMVHNGTDAYITTYNIVSSSNDSFIIFTADVSDGVARLKARSTGGTLNLKLHKLLLSDTESTDETDYQKIVGTTTTSSAAATIDSFHLTDTTAAFYTLSAHDTNNSQSSVSEVVVVHNGHEVSIIVGPQLSTDGTIHIEWSAYIRGNQLFLQASGSESEIKITGYRIGLYRPEAGNSNASLSAQGITFVGDDSTGTRISDNETVKITGGAGITTSMIGDVLTITATGEATAQGLTFVGDDSSGTRISDGETVKITGSGGVTTAMSGDTLTINGPTAFTFSVAGDDSTQRAISTGNTIKFVGSNGISTATDAAGNVTISGTTLVTLNIDGGATATVYDLTGLNLDGGSGSSTYGVGETSVNGGGA